MLTRSGAFKILREILETGGLTEDMESAISRLKDDFDEREGILKKYGETYDGEDLDDYEFKEYEPSSSYPDGKDWKQEYESMRQKYLDRFFGPSRETDLDEAIEENTEDIKRDGEPQTFEELLERREG